MTRLTRKQHGGRAVIAISTGLLLAIAAAVIAYFEYVPGKGTKWMLLVLPALPLTVWGCSHLARYRGYPSGAAYGLFVLGIIASNFVAANRSPLTIGFAFVFMALLPAVVLLVLPKKSDHFRHH